MAEGWTRHLQHRAIEAYSAGISAHGLNRVAVRVMLEAGVDISAYRSKRVQELSHIAFDCIITVCDNANEQCPVFLGKARRLHAGFDDPVALAQSAKSDEEALEHYRRVRDEIRAFIEQLPEMLYGDADTKKEEDQTMDRLPVDTNPETIREQVRERYGAIAAGQGSSCCNASKTCCGSRTPDDLASQFGYVEGDLKTIPPGANLGLSCGNPTVLAELKPGEVLLDLGSGAGFDAFLAGPRVGAEGRVIGVDMTPDMVARARRNLETYSRRTGLDNIEFRLGEIEHLPVSDAVADVIISNCVINLSPDKPRAWREMFRVLKPGGRVAVSDLAIVQALPAAVKQEIDALIGCIAGAALVEDIFQMAFEAGFVDIRLEPRPGYVEAMCAANDALYETVAEALPAGAQLADYVVSLDVSATRP